MKVIAIKSNTRLIKGQVYEVDAFNNSTKITRYPQIRYGVLNVKGLGQYSINNFTTLSGESLLKNQTMFDNREQRIYKKIDELKKGDVIVCESDKFAFLVRDSKYKIQDIKVTRNSKNRKSEMILLEGYSRWIAWSNWKFRVLSISESRDLNLNQILNQPQDFNVKKTRKIDLVEDKNKELIESIAFSILDRNRHILDVLEWAVEKNGKNMKIEKDDYKHLMDLTLSEILKLV